jgi:hypothetical protein
MDDEVIINLKLLASVGKHQKIMTHDAYLNVEKPSLIPECVRRWKRGDDRNSAIRKINDVVDKAISLDTPKMKEYLQGAVVGIANLKETYGSCHQTCARLDTILDKIAA